MGRTLTGTSYVLQYYDSGTDYCPTGELQSVDGYMNIALENTEEHVGGVKKRSYGDAFVRGNNGKGYDAESMVFVNR